MILFGPQHNRTILFIDVTVFVAYFLGLVDFLCSVCKYTNKVCFLICFTTKVKQYSVVIVTAFCRLRWQWPTTTTMMMLAFFPWNNLLNFSRLPFQLKLIMVRLYNKSFIHLYLTYQYIALSFLFSTCLLWRILFKVIKIPFLMFFLMVFLGFYFFLYPFYEGVFQPFDSHFSIDKFLVVVVCRG